VMMSKLLGGVTVEGWGSELRQLRRARRWTQEDLEEYSGLDQSSISQFENEEKRPSMSSIRRLARAFEISDEDLARIVGHLDPEPEASPPATPLSEFLTEIERQLRQIPGVADGLARNKADSPDDYPALLRNTARVVGILAGTLLEPPEEGRGD
jgi:transcriptional regulator with XRE-family HTH domain